MQLSKNFLTSPSMSFIGIIAGFVIGTYFKPMAETLAPLGDLYLAILGMCILPIVVTALVASVGKSLHTEDIAKVMRTLFAVIIVSLMVACVMGICIALILQPGADLGENAILVLSNKIAGAPSMTTIFTERDGFLGFLLAVVPSNIFYSLSQGYTLSVVVFSILLGLSLGAVRNSETEMALSLSNTVFQALLRIVTWIMYALPIGLCFLFAGFSSEISWNEIRMFGSLLLAVYGGSVLLIVLCSLVIWHKSDAGYWRSFAALRTPLMVAFGSTSSFASIPAAIYSLEKKLFLERSFAELVVPLGVNLFRLGSAMRFAVAALFIVQLYGLPMSMADYIMLIMASTLASFAVSGLPGIASAGVFIVVLHALSLPANVGMILFIAIIPITEPIVTLLNVQGNCALAMLMRKKQVQPETVVQTEPVTV